MRLKYLELQGYKTFASRTEFAFDNGITAIVGPNGSGKSNIADAIRWVLGEQSFRSLRGKRTEDMIFSGSSQRARLGMASAALTLDNCEGWLPVDFTEVTITRRAYRSGENEYLLNGSRVRLREITELLAESGLARRTYNVIGQGLVDAVLSLRPEDRRALFEEAAGITLYQSKRAEAFARLDETRSNLLRVNDIVNEIGPRLYRLEREAERAERHALLSRQLEGLLRTWYGFRWRQEQENLRRAREALSRRAARLDHRRQDLADLDGKMTGIRDRQSQMRRQLAAWHGESGELHRQMEGVQRDLAVWRERARLLSGQHGEILADLNELEVLAQATAERMASAQGETSEAQQALDELESAVSEAQADLDLHEEAKVAVARQLAEAQARMIDLATRAADRNSSLAHLQERREALAAGRVDHQSALADLEGRAGEQRALNEAIAGEQASLESARDSLQAEAIKLGAAVAQAQARQAELQATVAESQRDLERLQARHDLLSRLREEGEGLHAGVRAVLSAARAKQPRGMLAGTDDRQSSAFTAPPSNTLTGVVGTVTQLLQVPAEYEVAVEVALGGHLQDVVVECWSDAEQAIDFLREGRRGRATFLPLDTVRPPSRIEIPRDEGVIGVGADLVHAEERLVPVVEMLLGRTIVARDLLAARRVFGRLRGGFQVVTLSGEVLRSSGAVTGGQGQNQVQGQVLAREREWRELPGSLAEVDKHRQGIEAALDEVGALERQARDEAALLETKLRQSEQELLQIAAKRRDVESEAAQIAAQITWRQGLVAQLDHEAAELEASALALQAELTSLARDREAAETQVNARQAELTALRDEFLYQCLSEARTAAAVARGRLEHRQAALDSLRERQAQLQVQIKAKRERIAGLDGEQASLMQQIGSQVSQEAVIQGWLASLARKLDPAEAEVAQLEAQREGFEKEESSYRTRLREAENSHAQALLAFNREEDQLERLRRQIMDDFGLVEMEPTEGLAEQPPLPLGEMVSSLPAVETLPEGLEDELHQIKAQLRRMGAVNVSAPDEYAEVLDRHTFLTTQAADLEEAAVSLREVVAELDELMQREFMETFRAVAERFKLNFAQLFGGGSARLVLTEPDDVTLTGVEIVARPPGKRQQTLALLSGGERSLTAVALIFALLEVSPPPFCVLDEVDAMLDEANVQRFRSALVGLSQQTQFIVITHNRGTIQAADTIYGVSIGEDSVSQVVSLRLDGDRIATPEGATVDILKDG